MIREDFQWLMKHDPRWKHFADQIKKRDNYVCQNCGSELLLQAHHLRYFYDNRAPWEYPHEYLITLCNDCHEGWHKGEKRLKGVINEMLLGGLFPSEILSKIEHGKIK